MTARFEPPDLERVARPGGGFILRSRRPQPPFLRCLPDALARWAADAPDRVFLAERDDAGAWRRVTYAEALRAARGIGAGLLELGASAAAPLAILSGNSIEHALLTLGAMSVGVAVAPISTAYSLATRTHEQLRAMLAAVRPAAIYADGAAYDAALRAAPPEVRRLGRARVTELAAATPSAAALAAHAAVTGDTVAKLLFTSGSTGVPRPVVNTQRMLCANQAALAAGWPFLGDRPPVIVDWLPWSHTFGGNHNFHLVLAHGGTLYLDAGKPAAGAFETTLRNLREIPSTIYFNVPRGFDLLAGALETDAEPRATFFRDLDVIFYAAAALSPATWRRLEAVAPRRIAMTSAWGSTETSPLVTQVCFPIDRAGVIGVPIPGTELALVPVGDQLELRVRGPSVAPGVPLDELGFYPMGDAGRLADASDPNAGVVFDGRIAENFKLSTGTWVHVGAVRLALLAACSPLLADAAIAGDGHAELCALVFLAPGRADDAATRDALRATLAAQPATSSSTRVARLLIAREPPSIDAGEINDKGYLNQRAVLARRAADVARLYADGAPDLG